MNTLCLVIAAGAIWWQETAVVAVILGVAVLAVKAVGYPRFRGIVLHARFASASRNGEIAVAAIASGAT